VDSRAQKAFYQRSIANSELGNVDKAIEDIEESIRIGPAGNALKKALETYKE